MAYVVISRTCRRSAWSRHHRSWTPFAGLRANEARYFKNKYDHTFTVEPASKAKATVAWVKKILEEAATSRSRRSRSRRRT